MDYVFTRLQTGYDAVVLAYRQSDGQYHTYLLGKNKGEERFMFRTEYTEEKEILALVIKWVKEHLTDEDLLTLLIQCHEVANYIDVKRQLSEKQITYEVKGNSFYIRRGDLYRA